MDAVRQIVDGSALATLIRLPRSLHGKKVEVIVLPVSENAVVNEGKKSADIPKITRARLEELRTTSTASKLTGSIPHPYVTIQQIREERLGEKYGSFD